jgi:uncharacterized protein YndB with AHSA1/START domain
LRGARGSRDDRAGSDEEGKLAAAIRESIEISRSPVDVFAYLDDPSRHGEWQSQIVTAEVQTAGPTRVGTRVKQTLRIGRREQNMSYEITEHDPPRSFAFRGVDGAVRPIGHGTVEPVADGARSRVTIELDFEGHGLGKLLRPLVVSQARKQVPQNQEQLKERLESGAV